MSHTAPCGPSGVTAAPCNRIRGVPLAEKYQNTKAKMPKSISQEVARLEVTTLEAQLHEASVQLAEVAKTASNSSCGAVPSGEAQPKRLLKPGAKKASGRKHPRAAFLAPPARCSDEAALIEEVGRGCCC